MYLGVYIDFCFSLLSFPTPYIHNIFAWLPCIHLHILIIAYLFNISILDLGVKAVLVS